jgi:uncharacterized damage-inducible protein DinB
MTIAKPSDTEYAPFFAGYVGKVPAGGPLPLLQAQVAVFERLGAHPAAAGDHRYGPDKWTVKEVLGHMADAERVFAYRLLRVARADATPMPAFDEQAWAKAAPHARRPLEEVVDELLAVRRATLPLVRSLDETALARAGTASGKSITARALCWIIPGHAAHHLDVLRERYGLRA